MSVAAGFADIETALIAMRQGRPVLVLDDADRENEGDVVLAGATLHPAWTAWAIRYTSGYLCAPMTNARADALNLPLMVADSADPLRTAYTVTVDAAAGVSTGISAHDRTTTVTALADPTTGPHDFIRPGHVVPLRARDGGVLARRGHTEATVDLTRLAGLPPVGVIGELVLDDGTMMRTDDVLRLGAEYGLPVITIADLVAHRRRHDRVERVATTRLPTAHGEFVAHGYADLLTGAEHVALVADAPLQHGDQGDAQEFDPDAPLVRVHSECLTGDAFASLRCDCGEQLQHAMNQIQAGGGVLVYLRGHEGRGVGLLSKLAAYGLQDLGADTVDAQTRLGLPVDAREFDAAAAILYDLGYPAVTLQTNNPAKVDALREAGIDVRAVRAAATTIRPENIRYLRTKRDRMGHRLIIEANDATPQREVDHA